MTTLRTPLHLKKGDECPPLAEKTLRLYSMKFCPFVQRAKLVLEAKKIPYEEVLINLRDQPEWFLAKNSAEEVPVLEWIDETTKEIRILPESLIVCDYLDALKPENSLHPNDIYERARQTVLVSRYGEVLSAFYSFIYGDGENAVENLNGALLVYENALKNTFFAGEKVGMIDYMLWPWVERFPAIADKGFIFNADGQHPKLAAWIQAMHADPTVINVKLPDETVKKFIDSSKTGNVLFDI